MDQGRRNKRYCIAYWCLSSDKKNPNLSFLSLPKDAERRHRWLQLLGRDDLARRENLKCKSYAVCSQHFDDSQFRITRQLKSDALPNNVLSTDNSSEPTVIKEESSSKRKLTDKPLSSEDNIQKLCDSPALSNVIKDPIFIYPEESKDDVINTFHKLIRRQNELKRAGKRTEFKMFALNLLIHSPHAYQCLKTTLKLPNKKTLLNYKLNIPPNLDDKVLHRLELKLKSLPNIAKYCTICIDTFPLKSKIYYDTKADEITGFHCINEKKKTEMAKKVVVLMIQGIYFKWQQPIAYTLLGNGAYYHELDTWLNSVVTKLSEIGIKIKAINSDDSSYFEKFAKDIKNVTEFKPFIIYNNTPVYYVFDIPHLMISIRNYLLKNDMIFGSQKISWKYIKILYNHDAQKESKHRLLPKLTSSHVEPNGSEILNVRLAVESLSRTVSATLHTYIDFRQISEDARSTAIFVGILNDLFDLLNSSKVTCENELQSALKMTDTQDKVIKQASEMFAAITLSKENVKTLNNFQLTIKSITMLFEDFKKENLSYLLTKQLSKDCLRTFYEDLVSLQDSCHLTPIQFRRRFSMLVLKYLLKPLPTRRCGLDLCELPLKVDEVNKLARALETTPTSAVSLGPETDYQMDLPEEDALIYVSSYLLYKCTKKHKCVNFGRFWDSCRSYSESSLFNKNLNRKARFYSMLKIPPKEFTQYIQNLETTITQNFFRLLKKSPGTQLYKLLRTVTAKVPCACFPVSYLLKLFVRLRIYETLKFNNSGKNSDGNFLKIKHL